MEQTTFQTSLQVDSDDAFLQRFKYWGLGWFTVTFLFTIFIDYVVFRNQTQYVHDWHLPLILFLSVVIVAIYGNATSIPHKQWPLPLTISLPSWLGLYIITCALSFVNVTFAWYMYIVFGITLTLFRKRSLLLLVTVLFLSVCAFNNFLTWPLDPNNLGNMLGLGFSFYGTSALAMVLQTLVSERYERTRLLRQLAQTNAELSEAHQRLAETAAQEQELAVLRERTRLAREMHDTLGHALVLVTVKLEVAQRLRMRDPERCGRELEATQEIVRTSMSNLRNSIANLRSPALEHEPVSLALSHFAGEMGKRAGVRVIYDIESDINRLSEQVEETLWKVGQEALINIEKHAQATTLTLHMSRHDARILMRVVDDGIGLPCNLIRNESYESPAGHYGLRGMRERVESLGGTIQFKKGEKRGTMIEVELPLIEVLV